MASNMDFLSKIRAQAAVKENQNEAQANANLGAEVRSDSSGGGPATSAPAAAPKTGLRLGFLTQAGRVASAPQPATQLNNGATERVDAGESTAPDQGSVDAIAAPTGSAVAVLDHSDASLLDSPQAPGPADFQKRLDELDTLCRAETGITEFTHDAVKGRVKQLMIDLQSNPEMEKLIIDRDVHNIMLFIQSAAKSADSKFEVKAVKKEKTANNKSKTQAKAALFSDAFADMLSDVDMLAGMNTDGIETKTRK